MINSEREQECLRAVMNRDHGNDNYLPAEKQGVEEANIPPPTSLGYPVTVNLGNTLR